MDDVIKYFPATVECEITGNVINSISRILSHNQPTQDTSESSDSETDSTPNNTSTDQSSTDDDTTADESSPDNSTSGSETEAYSEKSDNSYSSDSEESNDDEYPDTRNDQPKKIHKKAIQTQYSDDDIDYNDDNDSIIEVGYENNTDSVPLVKNLLTEEQIKKENEQEFLDWVNGKPKSTLPNPQQDAESSHNKDD